jgi:hypothetical protein
MNTHRTLSLMAALKGHGGPGNPVPRLAGRMKNRRLARTLLPAVAARAWAPREVAPKYSTQLRELRRRVAAARLAHGSPSRLPRRWPYDDLQ